MIGAPDNVPKDRADAQDIWCLPHLLALTLRLARVYRLLRFISIPGGVAARDGGSAPILSRPFPPYKPPWR